MRLSGDMDGTFIQHRLITDYGPDGPTDKRKETFEADSVEPSSGDYQPGPSASAPGADGSGLGPGEDPGGEFGGGMAEWCAQHHPYVSGVERAAATDPSAIQLDCDDLVGGSSTSTDCSIIEWGRPDDFRSVLERDSAGTGCGPFEQPGEDGTCGPASGIEKLRGMTAWVASADLEEIQIFSPLVCDTGF